MTFQTIQTKHIHISYLIFKRIGEFLYYFGEYLHSGVNGFLWGSFNIEIINLQGTNN